MISFKNDYSEGACPEVLKALVKTNYEQTVGYGEDEYCKEARNLIKENDIIGMRRTLANIIGTFKGRVE